MMGYYVSTNNEFLRHKITSWFGGRLAWVQSPMPEVLIVHCPDNKETDLMIGIDDEFVKHVLQTNKECIVFVLTCTDNKEWNVRMSAPDISKYYQDNPSKWSCNVFKKEYERTIDGVCHYIEDVVTEFECQRRKEMYNELTE